MKTALLVLALQLFSLAQAQPRMVVDSAHYDFGSVPQGTTVSHRFKISNAGDAPLNILKMNTSCGCTSALVGRAHLEPGESTELEVTFNSSGLQGMANKSVRVVSDDPVAPDQALTFQAVVMEDLLASGREVQFLDLAPGDRRKATIKVTSPSGAPVTVRDVGLSEAPWLGVATREGGPDLYVDFELLARSLPKQRSSGTDTVVLHLENPRPTIVRIKVIWEKQAPVAATPARIAWAEPAGRDLVATVVLEQRRHKPFRIVSATTSNPFLQVEGAGGAASRRQRLTVRMSGAAPAGTYDEKVLLTLDAPDYPAMEIRVAASLR